MADPHDMTDTEMELEAFFAAGRSAAAEPSGAFLARVLEQAEAVQAEWTAPAPSRQGIWAGLLSALGGWGGASGLATATLAGVWLGFAGVQGSGTLTAFLAAPEEAAIILELIPEFDSLALAALETEG